MECLVNDTVGIKAELCLQRLLLRRNLVIVQICLRGVLIGRWIACSNGRHLDTVLVASEAVLRFILHMTLLALLFAHNARVLIRARAR